MPPPSRSPRLRFISRYLAAAGILALAAAPAPAAPRAKPSVVLGDTPLEACPGDPIEPDRVVEGRVPRALMGAYLMLPFDVPAATTSVRVKYCYEQDPDGHTVDLGIWQSRVGKAWEVEQFRGWGGSSHPDVAITPQGFSTETEYLAAPRGHVPGRTTRGFVPGPIPAGTWAAELGIGAVVPVDDGDDDGAVAFRVEIELREDVEFLADPYLPATYDETPANPAPGWYAGDMHVHAEHSALGDATMSEAFEFAFRPIVDGGAGLDFITLSDYVTSTGWGEIGRYQALHPGKLVIRSSEVITYRGHTNNHASARYVDHRTGPVYELLADGKLKLLRRDRDPRSMFKEVHATGGWTQLNHVTTCPSDVEFCRRTCRGCPWDYTKRETKPPLVDAIEVHTGHQDNPFTASAIQFWDELLAKGQRITAVGSSDAHHAAGGVGQPPIGNGATVVFASELSESGIRDGLLAGHAYVKIAGNAGPDLRFEGRVAGSAEPPVIMGDTIRGKTIELDAEVLNVDAEEDEFELTLVKDGVAVESVPVTPPGVLHTFTATGPGRYRLELREDAVVRVMTNPIYVKRGR